MSSTLVLSNPKRAKRRVAASSSRVSRILTRSTGSVTRSIYTTDSSDWWCNGAGWEVMNPSLFSWLVYAGCGLLVVYLIVVGRTVRPDTNLDLGQSFGLMYALIAALALA